MPTVTKHGYGGKLRCTSWVSIDLIEPDFYLGQEEIPLPLPPQLKSHLEDDCFWILRRNKVRYSSHDCWIELVLRSQTLTGSRIQPWRNIASFPGLSSFWLIAYSVKQMDIPWGSFRKRLSKRGKSWQLKSWEGITSFVPNFKGGSAWDLWQSPPPPSFAPHLKMNPCTKYTNCK